MTDLRDNELLARFVRDRSEEAFSLLVERHISLVYSTALRFTGNPHHAQEITQAVFLILSQKAASLRSRVILSGWLYHTARLTASNFVKSEIRRQNREQEAYMQSLPDENSSEAWNQIAPLLDEAMGGLAESDRNAIVLRFFENKSAQEVARVLNVGEWAAHKRVERALAKLRKFFVKRGVILPSALLIGAVSANSIQAAPVGLSSAVSAGILKGAPVSVSISELVTATTKMMSWLKIKAAIFTTIGIIAVGTVSVSLWAQNGAISTGPSAMASEPVLIVPKQSVGQVKAGMTEEEVIAVLGAPDKQQGHVLIYDKNYGMSVVCSRSKIVGAVFCGSSAIAARGIDVFKGKTKEGIGILSTRAELIKAYGAPTSTEPWAAGQEKLNYQPLGLSFYLERDQIFHIDVDLRNPQAK